MFITAVNSKGYYRGERTLIGHDVKRLEFMVRRTLTGIDTANGVVAHGTPAQGHLDLQNLQIARKLLNYGCWGQIRNQGTVSGKSLSKRKTVIQF